MVKKRNAKIEYNVLFEEREINKYDAGQSCTSFALGSPITWEERIAVSEMHQEIGTEEALRRAQYDIPLPTGEALSRERDNTMVQILALRDRQETVMPVAELYLCGGFRKGELQPEHLWIEDRTNGVTYDTFINRGGIAVINETGVEGQAFRPGCEASHFKAEDIKRIRVEGYTMGQLIAIAAGFEGDAPFPNTIAHKPEVLAAMTVVGKVNDLLADYPSLNPSGVEQQVRDVVRNKIEEEYKMALREEYADKEINAHKLEKLKEGFKDYIRDLNIRDSEYSYGCVGRFFSNVGLSGYSRIQKLDAIDHLINHFEDEGAAPLSNTDIGALTSGKLGKLVQTLLCDEELGDELKDKLNIETGPKLSIFS